MRSLTNYIKEQRLSNNIIEIDNRDFDAKRVAQSLSNMAQKHNINLPSQYFVKALSDLSGEGVYIDQNDIHFGHIIVDGDESEVMRVTFKNPDIRVGNYYYDEVHGWTKMDLNKHQWEAN